MKKLVSPIPRLNIGLFDSAQIPSLATKVDMQSQIKTLPICVRIFNVCQEHLTGFNLISQSRLTGSKLIT
jgi:hypothetical protein